MRRLLAALALTLALPALAQDPGGVRFAVFIPQQVISSSARAQKVFAELNARGNTLQSQLGTRVEEMKKLEQQLKSPALSEEGRAKIQREFQDGEIALKRMQEDSQVELQKLQQKAFGQFEEEIAPLLTEVAKEWKLQVVMQYQNGLFLKVDEAWLLAFSNEIAKRYDAKFEGGAKPAPASKPAAAPKPAAPAPKK